MTAPPASPAARLSDEQVRHFRRHGYLVVPAFLDATTVQRLRRDAQDCAAQHGPIEVRWAASHFDTFNGATADSHLPLAAALYDGHLLHELHKLRPGLGTIGDRRIGLSVNLIPARGKFQPHFDRHLFTAVLYANDDYEGGEMLFYPRIRYWLGHPGGTLKKKIQRVLDKYVRRQPYLDRFGHPVTLKPRAGDLLVFEGTRTYHAVLPVTAGNRRISIQFGYDRAGMQYDVSDYYGQTPAA